MNRITREAVTLAIGFIIAGLLNVSATYAEDTGQRAESATGLHVLELFTSEGCSSCPPADRLLSELAKRKDVIALSFHIDYWDRLGWKDPFSLASATARQRQYARLFSSSRVYTPQLVICGRDEVVGSRRTAVMDALEIATPTTDVLTVDVVRHGQRREVVVRSVHSRVNIALVQPSAMTKVERGENGGRTLSHINIVRDFVVVTPINGTATATLSVPEGVNDAFVVAYSQSRSGEINAVGVLR